ncbi:MAG: potassium channel protein [Chloroflexi bacterium]|nr:potassium channel protein [Chloroflexota bacterium]
MRTWRRLLFLIAALLAVLTAGVVGYMAIEDWPLLDAVYMTVITLTTVGYREVHELSDAGRIFTIGLVVFGVGAMLYGLTTMVQYFIEVQWANLFGGRRMKERISKLKDHIVLCGYGEVGVEVARTLDKEGIPFVAIDTDQQAVAKATANGHLYIQGDATRDETLSEAGIQRARGLVAAAGNDADNIFITLSAKGLRPDVYVVARADAQEAESKLKRAGADRVIFPLALAGRRLAMLALRPLLVDFVDTTMHSRDRDLMLEAVKVGNGSPVAGKSLKEGRDCCGGAVFLAVKKRDGTLLTSPPQETLLELGDELVVAGTRQQLRTLEGPA